MAVIKFDTVSVEMGLYNDVRLIKCAVVLLLLVLCIPVDSPHIIMTMFVSLLAHTSKNRNQDLANT